MNSIGMPGAVRLMPVATRARLRPYQERGLTDRRAGRCAARGPGRRCRGSRVPARTASAAGSRPATGSRQAGHVEGPLVGRAGVADDVADGDAQAVGERGVEAGASGGAFTT